MNFHRAQEKIQSLTNQLTAALQVEGDIDPVTEPANRIFCELL
jgi:hypothetical protein